LIVYCCAAALVSFQLLRLGIKQLCFLFVPPTDFSDRLISMSALALLTGLFLVLFRIRKIDLSIFLTNFSRSYLVGSLVFCLLFLTAPSNFTEGFRAIILLVYSSIITPIFEELIFRGYVWEQLSVIFNRESAVYLVSSVLFGIWHLGYFDSIALRVDSNLVEALFWKVTTGLCYGLI
jgi:uncharacterized protein